VPYPLLSDEWVEAARAIRSEYDDEPIAPPVPVRMNVVITEVPAGDPRVDAHLDTTGGVIDLDFDPLEDPDVTVTVDWQTTRDLLKEGDLQAAMAAFLGGRIKLDGDITKLLGLQAGGSGFDPRIVEVLLRLRELTA
jgi:hypothetical protein